MYIDGIFDEARARARAQQIISNLAQEPKKCETIGKMTKYYGILILYTVAFIKHYYRIDAKLQLTFYIHDIIIQVRSVVSLV